MERLGACSSGLITIAMQRRTGVEDEDKFGIHDEANSRSDEFIGMGGRRDE